MAMMITAAALIAVLIVVNIREQVSCVFGRPVRKRAAWAARQETERDGVF